jgi:uncharacterized membrane protein YkoI
MVMRCTLRIAIAVLAIVTLVPARAEEPDRPSQAVPETAHDCLDQKERRAESEAGRVVPLVAAMHAAKRRTPGTVVRARLCHGRDGLIYVLTVLGHDGKVARLTVDAAKGTLVGGL